MADSRGPDSTVTTQYFPNAYKPKIRNGNFSTVNGPQTNNFYTFNKRTKVAENLPRLKEFYQVMTGSIRKKEDIGGPWVLSKNGKEITEATVYTAEIVNFGTDKFTVKAYNGQKAKKTWRRDFLQCSNDWRREIPLFGYNKSSVPLLIFNGELVPIAQIDARAGWLGRLYLHMLGKSFGCAKNELWMDPTKGIFCRGSTGPKCDNWADGEMVTLPIPSDIELLKEDALVRYFSSAEEDLGLLFALGYSSWFKHDVGRRNIMADYQTRVVSSLTNSTIAFVQKAEWLNLNDCLAREEVLPNGMTRLLLGHDRRFVEIRTSDVFLQWLLQSPSIFHAHNIQLDEDLSVYELVEPCFIVTGTLKKSKHKQQRRRQSSPIFLFFFPSPSLTRRFYYWSHDPAGGIPLSRDRCKYLGLPFKFFIKVFEDTYYWPSKVYKVLCDYQISWGFDPKTTDFARFLGYSTPFEIVSPENRFEEVGEDNDICAGPEPHASPALDNASTCPEAETLMVPEFLNENLPEQSDDVYSLDELFREIEIEEEISHKSTKRIQSWPFASRGLKHSLLSLRLKIKNRIKVIRKSGRSFTSSSYYMMSSNRT